MQSTSGGVLEESAAARVRRAAAGAGLSWATAIYDEARARGKDRPHAVRITARAWIYVIWRCWQDSVAYDPAKHNALQNILARQQAGGAAAAGPADTR